MSKESIFFKWPEKDLAYLFGVDEAKIVDGVIVCSFFEDSKKYSCVKLALAYLDECKTSTHDEKKEYLDSALTDLAKYFDSVLTRVKMLTNYAFEVKYDEKTQLIVDAIMLEKC